MLDVLDAVPIALAGTSFALGARHGLDWDHIAAITDLTAPRPGDAAVPAARQGRRGLALSAWYCTGHGLVLAVLGALVLLLGLQLPARLDVAFELVVGVTLVALGGVVLYQLGRYRNDYRYSGAHHPGGRRPAPGLGPGAAPGGAGRRARRRPARRVPRRPPARHGGRDAHAGGAVRGRRRLRLGGFGGPRPRRVRAGSSSPTSASRRPGSPDCSAAGGRPACRSCSER
jgi:hypothetical protein